MLAKINSVRGVFFVLALALLISGCTPAGPRAMLKGKKYLDHGDVVNAVAQFRRATTLLATNAGAWNYLGVALQRAGQPEEAATAYQNALKLDHDLVEVYFNLGLLSLEQNRPDVARSAFTAYTLRRPNDATGWLKLGFAQLRTSDPRQAERSFSTVLSLKAGEPEAYNGLGLARLQTANPREAAQFFNAALQTHPDFAPALQNLITVNLQYLHDNKAALANCQAYLAIVPRPANYSEVRAIAAGLAQSEAAAMVTAPVVIARTSAPPVEPRPKPAPAAVTPPAAIVRTEPAPSNASREEPHVIHASTRPANHTTTTATPEPVAAQVVQVRPAPEIVTAPKTDRTHPRTANATAAQPAPPIATATEPLEMTTPPDEQSRRGFWHRLFNGDGPSKPTAKRFREASEDTNQADYAAMAPAPGPTPATVIAPAPATATEEIAATKPEEKPAEPKAPPPPVFPRYPYAHPVRPAAGDRHDAEGPFAKARAAEKDESWTDAEQWYQTAADADPSWFEAQYNMGVMAHRLHNYAVALPRYEIALALQPGSVDARYNFALALKAAGYATDAADELKRILTSNPEEVRAHLALANLCAQSLRDVAQARQHYVRVLELQPDNSQASDIRFWLSANPKKSGDTTP